MITFCLRMSVLTFLQNKRSGKDGYATVKLHMCKAYDWDEWAFLERMLRKLGFHEQ